jgi:hypothetical protein
MCRGARRVGASGGGRLSLAIFVSAVMPMIGNKAKFDVIGFRVPFFQGIPRDHIDERAEFRDPLGGLRENVTISGYAPYVEEFLAVTNSYQFFSIRIARRAINHPLGRNHSRSCIGNGRRIWDEGVVSWQFVVQDFIVGIDMQLSWGRVPGIRPLRTNSPKDMSICWIAMRYPSESSVVNVRPITGHHGSSRDFSTIAGGMRSFLGGVGRFFSSLGGDLGINQAFADEPKLPEKQSNLERTNYNQPEREKARSIFREPSTILMEAIGGLLMGWIVGWLAAGRKSPLHRRKSNKTPSN